MASEDRFFTLGSPSEGYLLERGSKFHAYAFPISDEKEASEITGKLRKIHPKASHVCTAWRIDPEHVIERSSDDGEPSGSAGRPILGQLIKHQLINSMIAVVRYFGGTKLGVPGLIESYRESAMAAISNASILEMEIISTFQITIPFDLYPTLMNAIRSGNILVYEEDFRDTVLLKIGFPKSQATATLLGLLKNYAQRDFENLKAFETHLGIQIEREPASAFELVRRMT